MYLVQDPFRVAEWECLYSFHEAICLYLADHHHLHKDTYAYVQIVTVKDWLAAYLLELVRDL